MGADRSCQQRTPASRASFLRIAVHMTWVFPRRSLAVESKSIKGAGIAPGDPTTRSQATMAINVQTIQGEWNHLCCLARQRWTQLTEDDLRVQQENIEQLVDRIQQKTGEGRDAIEKFFNDMTTRGSTAVAHAAEAAGQYGHHVRDQI